MIMKMKLTNVFCLVSVIIMITLSSCLNNNDINTDFSEWRRLNEEYISNCETETENGVLKYDKVVPVWSKDIYVLMKWHNDRSETTNLLVPMSNSTITVKYTLTNVEGDTLDSSSSFTCVPNTLVTGFWTAVTNMHENDTVTAIIPYSAGYGVYGSGSVKPFSTLIFGIRLDKINKLM